MWRIYGMFKTSNETREIYTYKGKRYKLPATNNSTVSKKFTVEKCSSDLNWSELSVKSALRKIFLF